MSSGDATAPAEARSDPWHDVLARCESALLRAGYGIAPADQMYRGNEAHYYHVGKSALRNIFFAMWACDLAPDREYAVLDFPCGYGRVLRFLRHAFPQAALTAGDVDREAVDFCVKQFSARPFYSHSDLTRVERRDRFDLIWCGSLLTHFDARDWHESLRLFTALLNPGGLLVFTTHGAQVARFIQEGRTYGLTREGLDELARLYHVHGFGFVAHRNRPTGISLSSAAWVLDCLGGHPELRLTMFRAKGWDGHQDVYACERLPDSDQHRPGRPAEGGPSPRPPTSGGASTSPLSADELAELFARLKSANRKLNAIKAVVDPCLPTMPLWVSLQNTYACNLSCPHCETHGTAEGRRHYNHRRHNMSSAMLAAVAAQALPCAPEFTLTLNGEPLASPNFDEAMVDLAPYGSRLDLITNGALLDARRLAAMLPALGKVEISMDGATRRVVETLRRGARYSDLLGKVRLLVRACELYYDQAAAPELMLSYTIMGSNIRELPQVVELAAALGVPRVNGAFIVIHHAELEGERVEYHRALYEECAARATERARQLGIAISLPALGRGTELGPDGGLRLLVEGPANDGEGGGRFEAEWDEAEIGRLAAQVVDAAREQRRHTRRALPEAVVAAGQRALAQFESRLEAALAQYEGRMREGVAVVQEVKFCSYLHRAMYVNSAGGVTPCCIVGRPVLGSVADSTVEAIWNGRPYQDFRRQFYSDEPAACCRGCKHVQRVSMRELLRQGGLVELASAKHQDGHSLTARGSSS